MRPSATAETRRESLAFTVIMDEGPIQCEARPNLGSPLLVSRERLGLLVDLLTDHPVSYVVLPGLREITTSEGRRPGTNRCLRSRNPARSTAPAMTTGRQPPATYGTQRRGSAS